LNNLKILVVGAGYVGIAMSVILSKAHIVILLDIDKTKVNQINQGISPIYEEGVDNFLPTAVMEGRLKAIGPDERIGQIDLVLICVGTPTAENGSVDLSFIQNAMSNLIQRVDELCGEYCIFVLKSTAPPGSTKKLIADKLQALNLHDKIGVAYNPEFLREGSAIIDAQSPDRVVIGTTDEHVARKLIMMYEECLGTDTTIYTTMSPESAEFCKYVSNAFLATKISFVNEIANMVEKVAGADIDDIMHGVGLDHRICPSYLEIPGAGAGYGGSCLPKDLSGISYFAQEHLNVATLILNGVQSINSARPQRLVDMLMECMSDIRGHKISVLGLAFKPNTDDARESPTIGLTQILSRLGAEIYVHDPNAKRIRLETPLPTDTRISDNLNECIKDSDGCILMTNWKLYEEVGLEQLTSFMRTKIFIDGRRVFSKYKIPDDVTYRCIGKPY
jgi:UDPglucose 6-dehydrogenase